MNTDIILIDDNEAHLKTTTQLFNHYGFSVKTLSNPLEAVHLLEQDVPRLIILDIMMPGMDGFSILKQLKEHETLRSIPVIILSGKVFPPERKKALAMGAEKFLTKPIHSKDLLKQVGEYL